MKKKRTSGFRSRSARILNARRRKQRSRLA
nr:ribosomal protein L34 [Cyanidioschyzonaceae sp. 1]